MYFLLCELPKKARRCRDEPYVFWYDNIYGYQPRDVFDLEPCHHQMLCMQFFIFLKIYVLAAKVYIIFLSCKFLADFFDKLKEKS